MVRTGSGPGTTRQSPSAPVARPAHTWECLAAPLPGALWPWKLCWLLAARDEEGAMAGRALGCDQPITACPNGRQKLTAEKDKLSLVPAPLLSSGLAVPELEGHLQCWIGDASFAHFSFAF